MRPLNTFFFPLLGDREESRLDGEEGNRIDDIAQGHAGIQSAFESDQHRFRHVQGHKPEGAGESDQPGTGRKAQADGKRVCESAPVPTVSGRMSRFNQEWTIRPPA